ncbi:MAG: lysophospholipase [Proteobacteria bacterium]|nr:lysophospholipase [Pseudomonadota bacterium]MDA1357031.1 lysophospholipase [Pseudomonadota bacterium]
MKFRWLRIASALALAATLGACASPHQQSVGPFNIASHFEADIFVAADGARLPLRHWLPEGEPNAVILALHGFNDYSNAFEEAGQYWRGHGIATYAYDQRGFGATQHAGVWPPQNSLIADVQAAIGILRTTYPGRPVHVLGESMGAAILLSAAAEQPLDADSLILAAPAVWARSTMNPFYRAALWLGAHLFPAMELTGRGLGVVASDNREMILGLQRDPLVIKHTRIDAMWGLVNLMDSALEGSAELSAPALILYGANDQLIAPGPTSEMVSRLSADIPVALYETGWHMLLRDLAAEIVWADIVAWIADDRTQLPSGAVAAGKIKFSRPAR